MAGRISRTKRLQDELWDIGNALDKANQMLLGDRIRNVIEEMDRRTPVRDLSRKISVKCTPEMRERIREYANTNRDLTFVEIAAVFGVNPGRVSESVAGFRE